MNEVEFKRHLKDLVHGHHHPEEHDWDRARDGASKKSAATKSAHAKPRRARKAAKRK